MGLLKNLVTRESLKNSMYDELSASCFSSESPSQGEETGVPPDTPCPNKHDMKEKKKFSAAGNKTVALLLHFAVAELPSDVFRETCDVQGQATDNDEDDDYESGNNNHSSTSAT
jgi:hypothetical protein